MAEYCPDCFEKLDALHICGDNETQGSKHDSGSYIWSKNKSLTNFVMFAPLAGLALDFVVPLPSSLVHSMVLSILGSATASVLWVVINFEGQKSLKFFVTNFRNFIYTPNLLKIFGATGSKRVASNWLLAILLSSALQIFIFTPGNAAHLAGQVSAKIHDASGANLKVNCPRTRLYFYNERMECRVRTGIFGITVPARIDISPILGDYQIKVSLL